MKKTLILWASILLSLIFGAGFSTDYHTHAERRVTQPVFTDDLSDVTEITPLSIVLEMIGQVNKDRILKDLRRLTGEEPTCIDTKCHTITNRETGGEGLQWAKDYVYNVLLELGYSVEIQDWSRSGYADQNLIAKKSGKVLPNKEVYFIAHLDGYLQNNPAADDNASGVVDLLELARLVSSHSFNNTVVLLFSTGEEHGSLGARSYVAQLSQEELSAIQYVVDVEMVGYDSDLDGAMELWSGDSVAYPASQVFANMLSEIIDAYQLDLAPSVIADCA